MNVILNSFADHPSKRVSETKPNPEKNASFLNRVFYHWYDALAWKGRKTSIEMMDVWDLKLDDTRRIIIPAFNYYLYRYKQKITDGTIKPKV